MVYIYLVCTPLPPTALPMCCLVNLPPIEESLFQPIIKLKSPLGNSFVLHPEGPQVVSCTSRSNNEDTFLLERGQCPSQVIVVSPIFIHLDGKLADGDISLRVHEHKWDPCPMIKPTLFVLVHTPETRFH